MRACARANGVERCRMRSARGITSAPPPSTDPRPSRRSVAPISRGNANALGFQHPGAFFFSAFAKGSITRSTRVHRAPEASGHAGPRQGKPRRRRDAPCLDASARAARATQRTRIGFFDEKPMRNTGRTVHSGAGSLPARCARRCRGVCRGSGEGVPRADESSEVEQRRKPLATGSNPVRPPMDSSIG